MGTAIITGASGGIGAALVERFRAEGYRVIALDLQPGEKTPDTFLSLDLRAFAKDQALRQKTEEDLQEALAGEALTVLIHNAAVQILGSARSLSEEDWRHTLDVNLLAPFLLSQSLLKALEAGKGSIIHIGSIHGQCTKAGFAAYATSKAALEGLTRSLALDLAPKIRVNAIAPAATRTPMLEAGFEGLPEARAALSQAHPLGRIAEPSEIADLALFLASDRARFLSGATIPIDGAIGARLYDPAPGT